MKLVIKIAKAGSTTIAGDEYVCQDFPDIVINRLRCLNAACNQFRNEGNSSALGFVLYWTSKHRSHSWNPQKINDRADWFEHLQQVCAIAAHW